MAGEKLSCRVGVGIAIHIADEAMIQRITGI
jgi:hypothetical protein